MKTITITRAALSAAIAGMLLTTGCGGPAKENDKEPATELRQANGEAEEYESFLGYCQSETISIEQQHTVSLLRQRLEDPSVDCETAFEELSNMPFLYLENVGIKDLSPIRGFKRLNSLFLVSNPITTTENLKNLPKLQNLDLDNVGFKEVPKLDQIKSLRFLKLDGNPITNLEGLPKWITNLWINHVPVKDLAPIAELDLKRLDANHLPKGIDWSPLKQLKKLKSLRINHNELKNIEFASGMTQLENLEANFNNIEDISPLEPLNKLRNVELNNNKIVNASMLFDKINMTILDMAFNDIRKIRMTRKNDQITHLTLDGNPIRNCEFVRFLPGLQELYLEDMQLATINGLDDNLPNLQTVSLRGNVIDTLTPLSNNKSDFKLLDYLDISGNSIKNFGPLKRIKNKKLSTFYAYDNPITAPYCPTEDVSPAISHFCEMLPNAAH